MFEGSFYKISLAIQAQASASARAWRSILLPWAQRATRNSATFAKLENLRVRLMGSGLMEEEWAVKSLFIIYIYIIIYIIIYI